MPQEGPAARSRLRRLAVAIALMALASACSATPSTPASSSSPGSAGGGTLLDRALDPSVLALPLVDEHGHTTSLKAYAGHLVVLTDFLTTCQEICPMTSANMHQAATRAQNGVQFLEITVDPRRDDAHRLAAYEALYGARPNWHVLTAGTGTPALWKELGVFYKRVPSDNPPPTDWLTGKPLTYDVQHQDAVFVLDGAGHERWITQGTPVLYKQSLPPSMSTFLDDEGRDNLANPQGPTWTADDLAAAVSAVAHQTPQS
jgi:protein SCO1